MALSQSALSELLDAFRAGEGVDLIRDSVRMVMQELIEVEASERIGAGRYERTDERVTNRNGTRPRLVATRAGDIELRIPKLRTGSFFPAILEPRRRIDRALYAVVMEAYVHGVSTRSVDDLVEAMGVESGISKSEVSRICAGLDEIVARSGPVGSTTPTSPTSTSTPTYLHMRNQTSQVVSMAVVVATGVSATVSGRSSAWTSATAQKSGRRRSSGAASSPRSSSAAWPESTWSSPTSTPDSSRRCDAASKAPRTSGAGCTSPATCSPTCPRPRPTMWPERSARSSPRQRRLRSTPHGRRRETSSPPGSPSSAR